MFGPEEYDRRADAARELASQLESKGVRFIQMEMPDVNGTLRGKIAGLSKGLGPGGTGVSTLMMAARSNDEITVAPWSNYDNGFPKMVAVPDYSTAVQWAWKPELAGVLCDHYMEDGSPCPMDGRLLLKRVVAEYEALGLEPHAAIEWELYIYEADDDLLRAKRFRDLKTFGRGWDFYSITRFPSFEPLATEFIMRMHSVGIDVEAFHTEYGNGMYEFTTVHTSPVKAADDATRAKTYLRQLCAEQGLVATFMPAIHLETADSHNGAHHNLSVWRDDTNLCWDAESSSISSLARHMAAGMMSTMREFHLLFRPWVNSHRRIDRMSWAPEDASWGMDNHSVGLRVVLGSSPHKYTRLEHRAPGPDVNPYLTLAAMLWGGLQGIRHEQEPPPLAVGDPVASERYELLPKTLPDSIAAFHDSAAVREFLGDMCVDHLTVVKTEEWESYVQWAKEHDVDPHGSDRVTDWEFEHYFSWV